MCPESFSRHLCPPLRPPRLTLLGVTGQVWPIMLGGGGAKNGEIYPCIHTKVKPIGIMCDKLSVPFQESSLIAPSQ